MTTITKDYVSFETAKLLKEKGFDERCVNAYISQKARYEAQDDDCEYNSPYTNHEFYDWYEKDCCTKPTLQMAMKWLREVHKIVCNINIESRNFYYYSVFIIRSSIEAQYQLTSQKPYFETYEEACEAAINYCLENLI